MPKSQWEELPVEVPPAWDSTSAGSFEEQRWIDDFADRQLEAILEEALLRNYDLKAAAARLDIAQETLRAGRADVLPSLNASGGYNQSRRSSASGIDQTPTSETYGLTGRFNWEIDLWGRLRNGRQAELADYAAAVADYRAARLSIAGRTAKAWYAAVEAEQQLDLARRTLETLETSQQIVEENFQRGIARALDVRLVRANVATNRSAYEQRLRARDAAVRSLETLLGRYPEKELQVASRFPELREEVPAGLPSELLLRRPDVLAAERRLAAAEQRKYEAKKALLPNLSLSLSRGTSANDFDGAFDFMDRRVWNQSLNIGQTLFEGGRLSAQARRARAAQEQALANLSAVTLTAFQEVEDELSAQVSYERDYEAQKVATEESVEAETLAWEEYSRGLADITTALDAVRRSITAQRSLIQVSNQRLQSRIDLYLALGGGFEMEADGEEEDL